MTPDLNADALRPLYHPWEEPNRHRERSPAGGPALVEPGRRVSRCLLAPALRHAVDQWRRNDYAGASDTTLALLLHWFHTAHPGGFRYHFCQREAIETIIWLYEVAGYRSLSSMIGSLLADEMDRDPELLTLLLGVTPEEDAWARYCGKIATGGGKTKVMSLAVVWSYFHRLFEPGSDLARHFVAIAPNLIVFERLKEDFEDGKIFFRDPLLPPEWKDQFQLQVVLQEETGGDTAVGALYLTNIHRLYERESTRHGGGAEPPSWAGPYVNRAQALRVGEELRRRIAGHPAILVLNDEAHHLHDPESAWNEALATLHKQSRERGNAGICAQLDFSATPKHNDGTLFRHIVCDFPLGEAVDAGIVKVPVIGRCDDLRPEGLPLDDAAGKWRPHLQLGYKQYEYAFAQWEKARKPILFVMTEDTDSANAIARALDSDEFPLLKGRVINLHTRLKGQIKRDRRTGRVEFVENEKQISDDDLKEIRRISRALDAEDSPYRCVVSVLMLREGWDVRNVTTIVPLRPYSAESGILPEQTLGRGLRRMDPTGEVLERVTVVEHSAFVRLYEEELALEGLPIEVETLNGPRPTSVSIFVDPDKPVADLEIEVPTVSESIHTTPTLEGLTFEEVRQRFRAKFAPLPIGAPSQTAGRVRETTLLTDEVVTEWELDRGLLAWGWAAPAAFAKRLERVCRLQGTHAILAPLVERFLKEVLFERQVDLFDGSVDHRLADPDVAEHILAAFTPLIREKTTSAVTRERRESIARLSEWKSYQATSTPLHPCVPADRTMFNLVPCDRDLEVQFADFCDNARDVAAFARNAGPQKLLIDYMAHNGRPALYVPDFFVRATNEARYLIEMKGQEDSAVPYKARAAVEWCAAASTKEHPWQYLFVPMAVFEANNDFSIETLARACAPSLSRLLDVARTTQLELPFEQTPEEVMAERTEEALDSAGVPELPDALRAYVTQAVNHLAYDRQKRAPQFGAAFQPLLFPFEQLSGDLLQRRLVPCTPTDANDRGYYFDPYLDDVPQGRRIALQKNQRLLQKIVVHGVNLNRIGVLLFCLDYANNWREEYGGVWRDVKVAFGAAPFAALYSVLESMNRFRGRFVAHGDEVLVDPDEAEAAMGEWVAGIGMLYEATLVP